MRSRWDRETILRGRPWLVVVPMTVEFMASKSAEKGPILKLINTSNSIPSLVNLIWVWMGLEACKVVLWGSQWVELFSRLWIKIRSIWPLGIQWISWRIYRINNKGTHQCRNMSKIKIRRKSCKKEWVLGLQPLIGKLAKRGQIISLDLHQQMLRERTTRYLM